MPVTFHLESRRRQSGFSLIDILVGLVIGLIAVLVIYQVYAASEGIKRNATSVGDAQQNGLLSTFMMSVEIGNAASALATAQADLMTCTAAASVANFASSWRPIPLLISDGGASSDSFIATYSTTSRLVMPAPFVAPFPAASAGTYNVQSPQGFQVDDIVVGVSKDALGDCAASRVTGVTAPDATGVVTITQTTTPIAYAGNSVLFNMGPAGTTQRTRYDISNSVLRSTSLLDGNGAPDAAPVPNPIASNIVIMKLLYGIDSANVGHIDTWAKPSDAGWTDVDLLAATAATLNKIKAIRIGIVVQGEQYDKDLPPQNWKLFDGIYTGAVAAGLRFRTYEMVVPLRNPIWNP